MRVYDAGTDWLTLTMQPATENYAILLHRVEQEQGKLESGGYELKPQQWQGYIGQVVCGLFVGQREDGLCIRASGNEAKLIEEVIRRGGFEVKCTRLDFQITAQTGSAEIDFGGRVREEIERSSQAGSGTARFNTAAYKTRGVDCGVTIGSRSSSRYSRFYNKTLEQRGRVAPRLWRYECEFKGRQAQQMFRMLMSAARGYWLAMSIVKEAYERHGTDMSFVMVAEKVELPSTYRPNDNERRLLWLDTHVRPTVQRLINDIGRDAVLQALALSAEQD